MAAKFTRNLLRKDKDSRKHGGQPAADSTMNQNQTENGTPKGNLRQETPGGATSSGECGRGWRHDSRAKTKLRQKRHRP